MKKLRALAVLPVLVIACCAPAPEPQPTPPPVVVAPTPTPVAPPVIAAPVFENWADAPQTPGDWNYRDGTGLSFATFSLGNTPAMFGIECQKSARTVRLVRGSSLDGQVPMRIRTETADRLLTATSDASGRPMLIATLSANDRLLDAIALSRGRFAVETGGMETLYLPAWAEITRVVEDCR